MKHLITYQTIDHGSYGSSLATEIVEGDVEQWFILKQGQKKNCEVIVTVCTPLQSIEKDLGMRLPAEEMSKTFCIALSGNETPEQVQEYRKMLENMESGKPTTYVKRSDLGQLDGEQLK